MVAMSGGVDSSVAAAIMKEQGYYVCGGTLRLYEKDGKMSEEVLKAKSVCDKLGLEHSIYDMREEFKGKVIEYFSQEYEMGLTPNPCVECNKHIKFGSFLEKAVNENCDYIASGHYAQVGFDKSSGRYVLYRSDDSRKDQTYVLWQLSQNQLSHILMPLGNITKDEVRKIAQSYGFVSESYKESQDICFVPDGNYAQFLENFRGSPFANGNYIDIGGNVLGQHKGHQNYTVGQRKGLGIALGKPQFVISKNPSTNEVVLGDEEHIYKKRVFIKDVNMIGIPFPKSSVSCTAKLRYSSRDEKCILHPTGNNQAVLEFEKAQRGPTAGQSAVFYSGDLLLGGGKIIGGE